MQISSTGTIIDEVASRLNIISADNYDRILGDINQCTRDIELSFPNAPFLQTSSVQTLSSGYSEYPADTNFQKMDSIINRDNGMKLTFLRQSVFDQFVGELTTSGSPTLYTILNNGTVKYAPIPDSSIDVEKKYRKSLDVVSASSSTPPLPSKYYELYCLYGEFRGLKRDARRNEAQDAEAEYERMKERMIKDLREQTTEPNIIRTAREFDNGKVDYGDPIRNIFNND